MIDIAIILTFLILVTLLGIKFGLATFMSTFSALVFIFGFFLVLILYFSHYPKISYEFQVAQKTPGFNDFYSINLIIHDASQSSNHYKEIVLYLEEGTLLTTDTGAEIVGAYARDKSIYWPYNQGVRIPLNNFESTKNINTLHTFPLLVPKDYAQTEITVALYLHSNQYDSGVLAIFNPMYNYLIKKTVKVDLTDLLNMPREFE